MIERDIIKKSLKEFHIKEYMADVVGKSGYSHTEIQRTPLGEKVIVYSSNLVWLLVVRARVSKN